MKVAVIGSRQYPTHKRHHVGAVVRSLPAGTVVGSGRASGVDELAEVAAIAGGYRFVPFPVDTVGLPEDAEARRVEFGKRAYARNDALIQWADEVIAFWTWCAKPGCPRRARGPHRTHGTAHGMGLARKLGKPMRLIGPDGKATS